MNKVLLVVTFGLSMIQAREIDNNTEIETVEQLWPFGTNSVEPLSFKDLKRNVLNLISERREILNEKIDWIQMMIHFQEDIEPLASWRPSYEQQKRDNERLLSEKEEYSKKKNQWLKDKEKLLNERDASYEQLVRFQKIFLEDRKQWLKKKEERDEWYSGFHNESKEVFATALENPSYEQLKQENENLLNQEMNWVKEELECLEEKNSLLRLSDILVLTRDEKEVVLENIREVNDSSSSE